MTIAYFFLLEVAQGPSASPGAHVARAFAAPRGHGGRRGGPHGAAAVEEQLPVGAQRDGDWGWGNDQAKRADLMWRFP